MGINVNHPSFISFLDNVTNTIQSNISLENYFQLSSEKKIGVQYAVLKLLKNAIKVRIKLSDELLKQFITIYCKKNSDIENFEFAGVLNDILKNFESFGKLNKTSTRTTRKIKTDTTSNEQSN
jgi:hypothetical protein